MRRKQYVCVDLRAVKLISQKRKRERARERERRGRKEKTETSCRERRGRREREKEREREKRDLGQSIQEKEKYILHREKFLPFFFFFCL